MTTRKDVDDRDKPGHDEHTESSVRFDERERGPGDASDAIARLT
jgi:hypothetical protein